METIKHVPIPIDSRLEHLSKDELRDLFEAYHYQKQSPSILFKKYQIKDLMVSGLRWVLKYREWGENSCPIHEVYSWQKSNKKDIWSAPFCPICRNELWSALPDNYFMQIVKNEEGHEIKSRHQKVLLSKLTLDKYQAMDFQIQVLIVAWFIENDRKRYLKGDTFYNSKFFPTTLMKEEYLLNLQEVNLLISNRFLLQEVDIENDLFEYFKRGDYLFNGGPKDYFNLWWDIAYHELVEYLLYELAKKNLIPQISPHIDNALQYMLKSLSVQQCMFSIWAAIKEACSLIAERNWDLDYANQVIPEQLKKKADRIIDGSLNEFPFQRPYVCPQSTISSFFFKQVALLGNKGFTVCPNLDIFYFDFQNKSMK